MFGKIIGTGSYVPENIVTNNDLTKIVETSDSWIEERTGVKQRHLMKNETTATMATEAAKRAVENAGIKPEEIDVIVVSTVSSNLILPNTACFVQEQIGAINAFCFDINTACTGFMMAYNTVQSYINSGLVKTALIIGAEGLSRIVDWSDRGTCILFGDGAGAAIVKASEAAVFETVMKSDGRKGSALTCYNGFAARPRKIFTEEKQEISDIYEKMNGQENSGTCKKIDGQKSSDTFVKMDGQEIFRFSALLFLQFFVFSHEKTYDISANGKQQKLPVDFFQRTVIESSGIFIFLNISQITFGLDGASLTVHDSLLTQNICMRLFLYLFPFLIDFHDLIFSVFFNIIFI